MSESETPASYRQQGNDRFVHKDYRGAIDLYTKGIEAEEEEKHLIYSNRSASKLALKDARGALQDADDCIKLSPNYVKGHLRRGMALLELERFHEAVDALRRAKHLKPESEYIGQQLSAAKKKAHKKDEESPPETIEQFRAAFDVVDDIPRLRLATMSDFWNLCSYGTRYKVFKEFLNKIQESNEKFAKDDRTSTADAIQKTLQLYEPDDMMDFPMSNYSDVHIPISWEDWFDDLDSDTQVKVLSVCWDVCSSHEQHLVIQDLRSFFDPSDKEAAQQRHAEALATSQMMLQFRDQVRVATERTNEKLGGSNSK
eukprot:gb/GECG01005270.1/.p1 GENE.gb/GECG01005270.1/~~gb/GECG01005270.1/.p1  ORF type:complete len:313 (+),score=56.44 gb/GECG01005270.1/:1-939(+)